MVSAKITEKRCQTKNLYKFQAEFMWSGGFWGDRDCQASWCGPPDRKKPTCRCCGVNPDCRSIRKGKVCRTPKKGPLLRRWRACTKELLYSGPFTGKTSRQTCVMTLQDHVGKRRMRYQFCYHFQRDFRI